MADHLLALGLGFLLDLLLGDPVWLYHPVCAIGKYIAFMEKRLRGRGGNLRRSAVVLTASTALLTMAVTAGLLGLLGRGPRLIGMALMDWLGIAVTSMAGEARQVEKTLGSGMEAGRKQVARIVGRDTQHLPAEGVTKAAIETVAENFSDGVAAPMLYMFLGGAPLAMVYKSINTMDSMVGYKNTQYLYFGRAAAKLDDVANYLPSRIAALLWVAAAALTGNDARSAWRIWRRDKRNHASPNSAQTESACAGALNVQLAGPAYYFGEYYKKPTIGDAVRPIEPEDIRRADRMMYAESLLALALGLVIRGIL